jgi:ADP-ribose pyrophosphatase YjhB (NUDIX family)
MNSSSIISKIPLVVQSGVQYVTKEYASQEEIDEETRLIELYVRHESNTGRCPLLTVDCLVIYEDPTTHVKSVVIGLFDKVKPTISGHKERICGAVMPGGHVESGHKNAGDTSILKAVYKEIDEEIGVTHFVEEPKLAVVYDVMTADPRNRIVTNIFIALTYQMPKVSEEISSLRLVPVQELFDGVINKVPGVTIDGEFKRFVLGHDNKILIAMQHPRFMALTGLKT